MTTWTSWPPGLGPNTVLATAYDLLVFFRVVDKPPEEVSTADVLACVTAQRHGVPAGRLRVVDEAVGVSSRTVARRLSIISGQGVWLWPASDWRRSWKALTRTRKS